MIAAARLNGEAIAKFALAGNATLTVRSIATGTRFTFKIQAATSPGVWFVRLLAGADNTGDYRYIGFIRERRFHHGGRKSFAKAEAPSVVAFGWFCRQALFPSQLSQQLADKVEVWHEGICGRCGRKLTVPESIESGLGPDCANLMARRAS